MTRVSALGNALANGWSLLPLMFKGNDCVGTRTSLLINLSRPLERHPNFPTCGHELQKVLRGMPTYDDFHSGRYYIVGCVIDDNTPNGEWACPECNAFVDIETD